MTSLISGASAQSAGSARLWTTAKAAYPIRRVAVLGAGTMGSRIAAHLANAGFPVLLLDLTTEGDRNCVAAQALELLKKNKPAALAFPALASRITVGNFDDDLACLGDCDWVIEAVAENLEIKRGLLRRAAAHLRSDAIVTTNTSGLPVASIAREFSPEFRRRWFGTHFFNPPRYMRLLEIIPTPESDPEAVASVARFADLHLGKTIVPAADTPNFIANRIGTFAMLNTVKAMQEMGLSIEEVDALTGSPLGMAEDGTFRLSDMVGIDVLASVVRNFSQNARDEREDVKSPPVLDELLKRKWLGDKTGQGFYKKQKGEGGGEDRLVLDMATLEYRPAEKPHFPALEIAKRVEALPERIRILLSGNQEKDKAAAFYWRILPELWSYAANRIGEVSESAADIDLAMRAGFNWELGPFEMWDAAGVRESTEKMRAQGMPLPASVERLLAAGGDSWYRNGGGECFDPATGSYLSVERMPDAGTVSAQKRARGVIEENSSVSLVDLGDGIACIEFHSKMNTLGQDIVGFVRRVLSPGSETTKSFRGFVFANDAANFSAGANLMQLLLAAQDEEWDEIALYIGAFQQMTQAVKFCPCPVVAAPFGLCLGGGTEICLHAAVRQPHLELYTGLVETGVGLIPAGGGCKEMTLRVMDAANAVRTETRGESVEVYDAMRVTFENIAMAKVSTSAVEARALNLLRPSDEITMNRARLLGDAKLQAVRLAEAGYVPPLPRADIPAPGESVLATLKLGVHMLREGQFISDHDATIGRHLANVLCGGAIAPGTRVSEQYLLELELEAFLSLCGERKTQDRIASTLKTGKPLRN